jgi:hypothetical protein
MDAVCDSSMFPYFTSNKPFRLVKRLGKAVPRVVADGVFTEPLWRFGCPDMEKKNLMARQEHANLDRCVSVSVFPMELVDKGLSTLQPQNKHRSNIISPKLETNVVGQEVGRLGLLACTHSKPKDLMKLYDDGWLDAERWVRGEEDT